MLMLMSAALMSVASAAEDDFEFELEGYYRTRAYVFPDLYADQNEAGRFLTQRLRLQPSIDFEGRAKFMMMADVLDDAVWGDNQSLASTALFAGDPSATGIDGQRTDTFQIKRAWMEFTLPVGEVRVGRMESHWGMGLLANSGNGFDDNFGENHDGNTFDRALFATRPLAIIQAITGKEDTGVPFIMGVAVDRLVEDPLIQYYGFECASGISEGDEDYSAACDSDNDGLTDIDHDYVDDTFLESDRGDDWWVDQDDDVMELIYLAIYRGEGIDLAGSAADFTLGAYAINRKQNETDSNVLISDIYTKFLWRGIYLEGEALNIRGKSSAIALPGAFDPYGELANPLEKNVNIWGWVARGGYVQTSYEAVMEYGYASGDDNVADQEFTGRPIHPDYNVGLILYDEILSRVTASTWTESADGLWSNGGVYNSTYIFPTIKYKPGQNLELIGGFLMAWPDKPDGSRILCAEGDDVDCAQYTATAANLGWEADAAIKYRFHNQHINFSAEAAYASITDRIPLENVGLNPDGKFFTFQSRIAYEF
ncbi:MAG: hypothetical protein P8R54_14565 [Myxococcota bacterium]|nr:hypothetical protein [Myxococcota bacterium]